MNRNENNNLYFRNADENDIPLILKFIRELADYEGLLHEVVATEAILKEWIFDKGKSKVIIGELDNEPIGFALYFYNFSTFLGRGGIYLEDLFVKPEYRGRGYGNAFMKKLANIAVSEGCGRLEWWCLDENKPSVDFYMKMNAKPMDKWTVYRIDGNTLNDLAIQQ